MDLLMHCSWEGLYDPNCIAFFSPKTFHFSCFNFVICRENNGAFTNTLHPTGRVDNAVDKKRHNFIYSLDLVGRSVINRCKDKVLSWVPRLLVVKLEGDLNVPA